jgi:hypothetical protein
MSAFSRYLVEIYDFAAKTKAKAVYCFVIDGDRGTGGCSIVVGLVPPDEYRARNEELIAMLRRSADLLQADIDRQVPRPEGSG